MNPGDTIILPDPGYPDYLSGVALGQVKLETVPLKAENDFLPDYDDIPEDVAKKAKFIYLNYPNNPTGAVATREFWEKTVAFAKNTMSASSATLHTVRSALTAIKIRVSLKLLVQRTSASNFTRSQRRLTWPVGVWPLLPAIRR